ncbi:MAG: hypothetical protein IJ973_06375 [Christensenellaceae bacterium]|nr:hypothetical protein [Christensenellaceae bacterium]
MENSNNYYNERNKDLILKIREITSELPDWFADFIRSIEPTTSALTRYNYCCDARIFLNYLTKSKHTNKNKHRPFGRCFSVKGVKI